MKNNVQPLISIVTISYNAVKSIEETILSVIKQSYPNIEYIIIDGGSTDGTIDLIKKYSKQISYWVSEPDKGIYDAMNKGIKKANGTYINFMNAGDTFWDSDVINYVVSKIHQESDIIYGDTMVFLKKGKFHQKPKNIEKIKSEMVFGHQACFIKTSYHSQNHYDLKYKSSADYNFFYNAYNSNAIFQYIPTIIANYDGADGMSKNIFISKKEDRIIQGKAITKLWLIKLNINYSINLIKNYVLSKFPDNIVNLIREFRS